MEAREAGASTWKPYPVSWSTSYWLMEACPSLGQACDLLTSHLDFVRLQTAYKGPPDEI